MTVPTVANEEYLSYVDYLKSIKFENILEKLKLKYADKKVLLFGTGVLLDAILNNYDIEKYLNVIGVSDKRVTDSSRETYGDYKLYKPQAIRALSANVILDTSVLFEKTSKYLKHNKLVKKTVEIAPIIQIPLNEKLHNFVEKQKAVFEYLTVSKNIFNALYYGFALNFQELKSKTNYLKKLKKIRNSKEPLKVAFICQNVLHTEFVGLYNLLYFDKDFKVFPIIITPEQFLETAKVDEEEMQRKVNFFGNFDMKVIDAWDRETKTMPCIHAFKPDLIFYQMPIYIKDDYSPYKMSSQALTFTIEYDTSNADFTAIGSKYFRKQVSNMWKIFVNNDEDKKLYEEYTDIKNKNIVKELNKNLNTSIVKYLKNTLNRK